MREFIMVKRIVTKTFEIEMYKDSDTNKYRISYKASNNNTDTSEWISDFGTASYLFDLKIVDLGGVNENP